MHNNRLKSDFVHFTTFFFKSCRHNQNWAKRMIMIVELNRKLTLQTHLASNKYFQLVCKKKNNENVTCPCTHNLWCAKSRDRDKISTWWTKLMFGQETIQIAKIQSVQICKPFTYCIKNESGSWKSQARAFSQEKEANGFTKLSVHSLTCRNLFWYESTSCMMPNRWRSRCDKISTWWALNLYAWIENRKICNSLKEKSGNLTYNFVLVCIIIG